MQGRLAEGEKKTKPYAPVNPSLTRLAGYQGKSGNSWAIRSIKRNLRRENWLAESREGGAEKNRGSKKD